MVARDVQVVLRAFADVRNSEFYPLYAGMPHNDDVSPDIEFRIYPTADSPEVWVVLGASGRRSDGFSVSWMVSCATREGELVITAGIGVDDGTSVVSLSDRTADPDRAAQLIRQFAHEVCSHRDLLDTDEDSD